MTDIDIFILTMMVVVAILCVLTILLILRFQKIAKKIHPSLQATVNRAYSKAQQALENSVEAIQIAKGEVPEKPSKPCNSSFGTIGGVHMKCALPKYPGHEVHSAEADIPT